MNARFRLFCKSVGEKQKDQLHEMLIGWGTNSVDLSPGDAITSRLMLHDSIQSPACVEALE